MKISSSAFENGGFIPAKYTGEGEDVSPPLRWEGVPDGVKSFALICDDPDAPGKVWIHWVVYCIPADSNSLPEAVPAKGQLDNGTRQGITDFGKIGYGGPMPPRGPQHRYFFKLYALDFMPNLKPGITKKALLEAIDSHIIAKAELVGLYKR